MLKLVGLLLLLVSPFAQAGEGRVALDKFLADMTTLEARFEQAVLDTEHSRQGLLHGTLLVKRPNRFRWDYIAPEPKQIIADGHELWVVEDDLEQITQHRQSFALKNTPASLLLSDKPIDDDFKIVELGERRDMQWLELLPRDPESDIVRILLAFQGDNLKQLELTDNFGQISRFSFFDIKQNAELDDQLFVFQPPHGWDIYQQ